MKTLAVLNCCIGLAPILDKLLRNSLNIYFIFSNTVLKFTLYREWLLLSVLKIYNLYNVIMILLNEKKYIMNKLVTKLIVEKSLKSVFISPCCYCKSKNLSLDKDIKNIGRSITVITTCTRNYPRKGSFSFIFNQHNVCKIIPKNLSLVLYGSQVTYKPFKALHQYSYHNNSIRPQTNPLNAVSFKRNLIPHLSIMLKYFKRNPDRKTNPQMLIYIINCTLSDNKILLPRYLQQLKKKPNPLDILDSIQKNVFKSLREYFRKNHPTINHPTIYHAQMFHENNQNRKQINYD